MKLRSGEVSIGNRFIKVGDYSRTVYIVDSLVESHGFLPHARLVADGERRSTMLMSASALSDPRFWSRVTAKGD
jgi:hypothetical protein